MVAPVPAQFPKLPLRPSTARLLPTRAFGIRPPLTPLLLIIYIQPQYFHAITHSFAQRQSTIPPNINSFRTLLMSTGVYSLSVPGVRPSNLQTCQLSCLHRLGASLPSLCALFGARFLCFQSLAASFPKIPGVGYPECNYGTPGVGVPKFRHPCAQLLCFGHQTRFMVAP